MSKARSIMFTDNELRTLVWAINNQYLSVQRPFDRTGAERYIPEINYCDGYFEHKEPYFSIQTISYGSLEIGGV